ncbi:AsnC family protein [Amycolatopsis benzoatilytica]|uniref:AsnC family protein n=1 Tax=Amycolatopsis benzoatilytica TaxID=346045 RepID=UPI000374F64D
MTDPADIRLLAALAELGKGAVHELAAKVGMDPREVAYRLVALSGSGLPLLVGVESDPNGLRAAISGAPASWQRPQGGPGSAPFPAARPQGGPAAGPQGGSPSTSGPVSPAQAGMNPGVSGAYPPGPNGIPASGARPNPAVSGAYQPGPNGIPAGPNPGVSGAYPPPNGPGPMPGPGTSGAFSAGPNGIPAGPGMSGSYSPGQTGLPNPGRSGAYAPAQTGLNPGVSGSYPPGPNGIPAAQPYGTPAPPPNGYSGPAAHPDPVLSTWGVPQTASWARGDDPRPAAGPAKKGRIGETMQSQGLEGEQLSVQLLEVQDPADFLFGAAGYRLEDGERAVVVHTEITNRGPIPFASLPDNYLELVTDSGDVVGKAPVSLTSRPPHKIGVQPGETLGGHTVYVLPDATRVVAVRWSPRPEPDERTLTWSVD